MLHIGIDPGQKGGIGCINNNTYWAFPMPDAYELHDLLYAYTIDFKIKHVLLEKAHAMPKQGVTSMFNYGEHFGVIQGILIALKIPYTLITPKEWQKEMFTGVKSTLVNPKEKAALVVQRLFPKERFLATPRCKKPHDGMIDSMLIAEYCRRKII